MRRSSRGNGLVALLDVFVGRNLGLGDHKSSKCVEFLLLLIALITALQDFLGPSEGIRTFSAFHVVRITLSEYAGWARTTRGCPSWRA
jgi:hypothetical protein